MNNNKPPEPLAEPATLRNELTIALNDNLEANMELAKVQADNARLRKMLWQMTRLVDWMNEGYTIDEYNSLVDEFERVDSNE